MISRIKSVFIIIIFSLFFSYPLMNIKFGQSSIFNNLIFSIRYEYFGFDSDQIEKIITIPLEEKLFQLDNIIEIKSTSQMNQSITNIIFNSKAKYESTYIEIRKITDQLSNELPPDVQNCKILASESNDNNIVCISFNCNKNNLNKYKQLFESIDGVTEVSITGKEDNTIYVEYTNSKIMNLGITSDDIRNAIQIRNADNTSARYSNMNSTSKISFINKISTIEEINNIIITKHDRKIPLKEVATIYYDSSPEYDLFLVNNNETTLLNIKAASNSNWMNISNRINKLLHNDNLKKFTPVILYDQGKQQKQQLKINIFLIYLSIFLTSLFIALISKSIINFFYIHLIFILSIQWTFGTFSILNFPINSEVLTTVYSSILFFCHIPFFILIKYSSNIKTKHQFIITSLITSILLFLPMISLKNKLNSFFYIMTTSLIMFFAILILSLLICSSFCKPINIKKKIPDVFLKFKINKITYITLAALSLITFVLLFTLNSEIKQINYFGNIKIETDFNTERSINSIQTEMSALFKEFQKIKSIKYYKTEISKGKCSIEIIPNKLKKQEAEQSIKNLLNQSCFDKFYIPEKRERNTLQISIIGSNIETCHTYARELSRYLSTEKQITQIILNFKRNEKQLKFTPDFINLLNYEITVKELSDNLRTIIYSPVISKLLTEENEIDIRLKSDQPKTLSGITDNYSFKTKEKLLNLTSLGTIEYTYIPSKIQRLNSKHCATITLEIKSSNLNLIKELKRKVNDFTMNEGYSIHYDDNTENIQNNFIQMKINLTISLLSIFILLSGIFDNIKKSLLTIVIPFSLLSIPLIIMFILGKQLSDYFYAGIILYLSTSINITEYQY